MLFYKAYTLKRRALLLFAVLWETEDAHECRTQKQPLLREMLKLERLRQNQWPGVEDSRVHANVELGAPDLCFLNMRIGCVDVMNLKGVK